MSFIRYLMKTLYFYYIRKTMGKKRIKKILYVLTLVIFLSVFMRIFVGEPCYIPSASMEPTIKVGDWLWIDKSGYGAELPRRWSDIPLLNIFTWIPSLREKDQSVNWGYHRFIGCSVPRMNDLIVFRSLENEEVLFVKRVSEYLPKGILLFINADNYEKYKGIVEQEGHKIKLVNDSLYIDGSFCRFYKLKNDFYYVLGDNASISRDSRFFGYISEKNIIGRVKRVLFSVREPYRVLKGLN